MKILPNRFPIEPYLADEPVVYRFVAKWNYKIIYVVEDSEILIIQIFDTRQSPNKMKV